MTTLVKAIQFADQHHNGQTRKYSGEPYIEHPLRVMNKVILHPYPGNVEVRGMAAVLHDVVEDCNVSFARIGEEFGCDVKLLVVDLTNIYSYHAYPHINRATRKAKEICRLVQCDRVSQLIKLYDRLDNVASFFPMTEDMADFALVYANESLNLAYELKSFHYDLSDELFRSALALKLEAQAWK